MTFNPDGARMKPDRRAQAAKAARVVVEDGVTRKDAMARFGVGWTYLKAAIKQFKDARAARSTP